MSASERDAQPRAAQPSDGCSMSDLLASCAAATAISTPPPAPATTTPEPPSEREAA
ncbi:hypothetical protein [Streptomyces sp. G45]|uniref:hypothetical protein n=1 Tax=Streptomyces sp. G45 TaxID=3406627 RepID=UPI003C1BABBA